MTEEELRAEADRMCRCLRDIPTMNDEADNVSIDTKLKRHLPPLHTFASLVQNAKENNWRIGFSNNSKGYASAFEAVCNNMNSTGTAQASHDNQELVTDQSADGYTLFLGMVRRFPNGEIAEVNFGRTITFLYRGQGITVCVGRTYYCDGTVMERARSEYMCPSGKTLMIEECNRTNFTSFLVEMVNLLQKGKKGIPDAFPQNKEKPAMHKMLPCPVCGSRFARLKFDKTNPNGQRLLVCENCGHSVVTGSVPTVVEEWNHDNKNTGEEEE